MKRRTSRKVSTSVFTALMTVAIVGSAAAQTAEPLTGDSEELDTTTAKGRAAPKHGTYYSMQLKNPPPLPFNPFPDLPVYEIGDGKYLYDDREVDYRAIWRAAAERLAAEKALRDAMPKAPPAHSIMLGVRPAEGGGGGFQTLLDGGETPEHLQLVLGAGGTNTLLMSELRVGSNYYVMAKQDITPNIDNPWYFVGSFVASSPSQVATLYSTSSIPKEFYTLWRGEYFGPRLSIDSPTNGAVVSGDVALKLRVTDISPVSLYAYVNGQPLAPVSDLLTVDLTTEVGVKHSGSADMLIPAGALRNGENHISIVAMNHGVEVVPDTNTLYLGNIQNFSTTRDIMIVASNNFAIVSTPTMASPDAGPSIHQLETTEAGDVTLDVLGLDGSPCKTLTATVTNPNGGVVTFYWDYTKADSSPYTNSAYVARYTFTPAGGGMMAAGGGGTTIWFTNKIDKSPLISGSPLLTWMELDGAIDALCDDVFDSLYDFFSWAIPQLFYTPAEIGENRTHPVKWKFMELTMTNDVVWFHRFMTNRNFDTWVYHGHCNQQAIGFATPGGGPGPIGTTVTANDVGNDLGNLYGTGIYMGTVEYKRRLRTVVMHGCWTANINGNTNGGSPPVVTEWPNATGTPIGVDQTLNRLYKTVFVGFENVTSPQPTFIEALLYDWPHPNLQVPNAPIVDSVAFALDFAWEGDANYIRSLGPKTLGFAWLPYRTIYDAQIRTNDFSSIDFFWW